MSTLSTQNEPKKMTGSLEKDEVQVKEKFKHIFS